MQIQSPIRAVGTASSTGSPLWNPLTDAISTAGFTEFKPSLQFTGDNGAVLCPGLQYSDDGVNWDSLLSVSALTWQSGVASYLGPGATGWRYGTGFLTWPGTLKRFCRFGVLAQNGSGDKLQNTHVQLFLDTRAVRTRVVQTPLVSFPANGGVVRFFAATGAVPTAAFTTVRASWELADRSSANVQVQAGMQTSEDGVEWSNTAHVRSTSSYSSTVGWNWGTVFEDGPTKAEYVRFGFLVSNQVADTEMGLGRLIIEGRGV